MNRRSRCSSGSHSRFFLQCASRRSISLTKSDSSRSELQTGSSLAEALHTLCVEHVIGVLEVIFEARKGDGQILLELLLLGRSELFDGDKRMLPTVDAEEEDVIEKVLCQADYGSLEF
ncbi:hypothetical protein WR25_18642 [Diploscapter pachys]|uniref:Uncharacterized protein n=1 Tax=Diploscapter pachys TaxID=2018661 RepID=A0A2A2KBZ0_9BILA|nr:hypothetical protein WR25_18642 [Diploscapter pachys]